MGSTTSATTPSSGSMQTSLLRWKRTRPSRRRLRARATRSSPSSTEPVEEELQEALTWEAWEVELHQELEPLVAKEVLDLLLRKWTNLACNHKSEETSGTKADTAKSVFSSISVA